MTEMLSIERFDDPDFDPFLIDDDVFGDIEDPYLLFDRARADGPVQEGTILELLGAPADSLFTGVRQFRVIGNAEVQAVLRDPALFSNDVLKENLGRTFGDTISVMNGTQHQAVRGGFQPSFMPSRVRDWSETLVDPVVNQLIGRFAKRGSAELVEEFAKPYPFEIIYRQLGLPAADVSTFHRLAVTQTFNSDFIRYGIEASEKLGRYFTALLAERRRSPGDDLVSMLAQMGDARGLTDSQLISFCRGLINAAGDTTYRATGVMLIALLSNPDQLEAVRGDRALVPRVLEETLRWNGPIIFTQRSVMADTELAGVRMPAGSVVNVSMAAANNDPAVHDDPRRFDIMRGNRNHFGFGLGPHMCLGQHLARLEMTRALNAILDRLPNLRWDRSKPRATIRGGLMRTPRDVHVLFDA